MRGCKNEEMDGACGKQWVCARLECARGVFVQSTFYPRHGERVAPRDEFLQNPCVL